MVPDVICALFVNREMISLSPQDTLHGIERKSYSRGGRDSISHVDTPSVGYFGGSVVLAAAPRRPRPPPRLHRRQVCQPQADRPAQARGDFFFSAA